MVQKAVKKLLVILDGIGDLPHPDLGGKTPLMAGKLPHLQKLARSGITGLQKPAQHIAPESDVGVCSVLGHNPFLDHLGRGLLEAKGAGIRFATGDLALRANFATAGSDGKTLIDRRVGRGLNEKDAQALAKEINQHVKLDHAQFEFKATKGHRGVLVLRSDTKLDHHITNTDPAYEVVDGLGSAKLFFEMKITPAVAWKKIPPAEKAAGLVNEFTEKSFQVLQKSPVNAARKAANDLPANAILLRDPESRDKKLTALPGKWAILSEMPMEEGIAQLMDMAIEPMYHDPDLKKAYPKIAKQTADVLKKYDGLYVHLKAPDVFGHDGDALGKTKAIEQIDAGYFGPLLEQIDPKSTRVLVTGDHATPCIKGAHTADPVPYLLAGAGIPAENHPFDETAPGHIQNAWDLMGKLLGKPS